jgi:hypothetical protein
MKIFFLKKKTTGMMLGKISVPLRHTTHLFTHVSEGKHLGFSLLRKYPERLAQALETTRGILDNFNQQSARFTARQTRY